MKLMLYGLGAKLYETDQPPRFLRGLSVAELEAQFLLTDGLEFEQICLGQFHAENSTKSPSDSKTHFLAAKGDTL
jgi:hypothetical protein